VAYAVWHTIGGVFAILPVALVIDSLEISAAAEQRTMRGDSYPALCHSCEPPSSENISVA
jgi:hypothetical protein